MVLLEKTIATPLALFSFIDIRSWIEYLLTIVHQWSSAISNPKQFLTPHFQPGDNQVIDGLQFYFPILVFSLLLYAPFVLGRKSEFAEKIRLLASTVVGLLIGLAAALSWHLAFWLMGGGASFSGTYLVSVYAGAPYVPLISIFSLFLLGALPPELQPLALNPATTQKAMQLGMADPRTNTVAVAFGSLLVLGITVWMTFVMFRCMSFVHSLGGWRLVVAIVVSLLIGSFVFRIFQFIQAMFSPQQPLPEPTIPNANELT
jgi:hypothetical protein